VIARTTVLGVALIVMIGAATQAQAEPQRQAEDDFSSSGLYAGLGFAVGFENFDTVRSDLAGTPVGFDSWLGYRVIPNLAAELELGYLNGFEPGGPGPSSVGLDVLAFTGNLKAYLLTGRVQPFVLVGIGLTDYIASVPGLTDHETELAARFGGGIDVYLTESFALQLKSSYMLTTRDLDGLDYVDLTFGGQIRF
jgi:hypothetical protein